MANKNGWLANLFKPREKKVNRGFNDLVSMVGYEPKFSNFGSQVLYSLPLPLRRSVFHRR